MVEETLDVLMALLFVLFVFLVEEGSRVVGYGLVTGLGLFRFALGQHLFVMSKG